MGHPASKTLVCKIAATLQRFRNSEICCNVLATINPGKIVKNMRLQQRCMQRIDNVVCNVAETSLQRCDNLSKI